MQKIFQVPAHSLFLLLLARLPIHSRILIGELPLQFIYLGFLTDSVQPVLLLQLPEFLLVQKSIHYSYKLGSRSHFNSIIYNCHIIDQIKTVCTLLFVQNMPTMRQAPKCIKQLALLTLNLMRREHYVDTHRHCSNSLFTTEFGLWPHDEPLCQSCNE